MADQVLFLSITTDEDLIPKSQEAVAASSMATAVSAAPAGLGYIVCGVGANISIGDIPISDLGAGDIDVSSNTIECRNLHFNSTLSGNDTSEILGEGTLNISGAANFGDIITAAGTIKGATLSATNIAASTCPIPAPYCFMQTTTDGTSTPDETNIGGGATVTVFGTNPNYITWNDTDKAFNLSAAGIYEINAVVNLSVDSTTTMTLKIVKKTGGFSSVLNTFDVRMHSSIDPQENSISTVYKAVVGDSVYATYEDDGSTDITPVAGCTIMIRRLS
jgi:hypothetical protein